MLSVVCFRGSSNYYAYAFGISPSHLNFTAYVLSVECFVFAPYCFQNCERKEEQHIIYSLRRSSLTIFVTQKACSRDTYMCMSRCGVLSTFRLNHKVFNLSPICNMKIIKVQYMHLVSVHIFKNISFVLHRPAFKEHVNIFVVK